MILTNISLNHAGCIYIFLHRIIQHVILIKHLNKMRMRLLGNKDQHAPQNRDHGKQKKRDRHVDGESHDP